MLQDIKLNKVVLEVRYRSLLWMDKPGQLMQKIEKNMPEWKFKEYTQEGLQCFNQRKRLGASIKLDKAIIVQNFVENLNQFKEVSENIIGHIVDTLEIKNYSRIGNRYWFLRKVNSAEEAEKTISRAKLLKIDPEKIIGFGDKILHTETIVVVQKGDIKCRLEIKAAKRDVPDNLGFSLSNIADEYTPTHAILYDFDVFQDANLPNSRDMNVKDFIQKAYKTIENNFHSLR